MKQLILSFRVSHYFWGFLALVFALALFVNAQRPPLPAPGPASGGGWTDDGANVRLTDDADNVGIGTALPQEKLEVNGNVRLGGSSPIYTVTNIADPVNVFDAATKAYVDLQVAQAADPKILRIFSDSVGARWGTGSADILVADIKVDIPPTAVIKSARLIFEGVFPQPTARSIGAIELKKDGGSFVQILPDLGSIFPAGVDRLPIRLIGRDITNIVTGSGIYTARFGGVRAVESPNFGALSGNYIIEIEFE